MTSRSVWPGDELHREEDACRRRRPGRRRATTLGWREPGGGPGLAHEPGGELVVVAEARVHHLDRDRAVEADVGGLVDAGHAAAGDPRADPVAAVEQPPVKGSPAPASSPARARWSVLHDDPPAAGWGRIRGSIVRMRASPARRLPRAPAWRGTACRRPCEVPESAHDRRPTSPRPTSAALVPEWLDWAEAAAALGVTAAKVRTMIRDHELAAAVPTPGAGPQVPADFIQDGLVVKGLPGLLTVLHDGGLRRPREHRVALHRRRPARPPDRRAAREPRRRGQAPRPGDGALSTWPDRLHLARVLVAASSPPSSSGGRRSTARRPSRRRPADRAVLDRRPRRPPDGRRHRPRLAACRGRGRRPAARGGSDTVALIDAGGPVPLRRGRRTFDNSRGSCPTEPRLLPGVHRRDPGSDDRGARRIVERRRRRALLDRRPLRVVREDRVTDR